MIPAKHSGRGSGANAKGGTHPLYCQHCGKQIKIARGKKSFDGGQFNQATGNLFGGYAVCGKCMRK